ncbi:MAG: EAL and GGDEF domain-containing protein [Cellvibrionaceae bacterium]|nr:EAL and GGDEF domain-containing protein [Cellvibrionaceae bacterium]
MRGELQSIIAEKSVNSLFQPIIDKASGEIFAYEALSRGPSDSVLHSPTQLIEQAQQHGLLAAIEHLCRQRAIERFCDLSLPGKLFLNVSPQTIQQVDHQQGRTLELLAEYDISPEQIVIELTEQHPGSDEGAVIKALQYYQEMGFAIALDDLGAGYSSLRLWSQVKPEFVKIDRHFIEGIEADPTKQEFVRSFVEIAQSMHCKVIAEGVETESEFEYLCQLKVDYLQGYFFCRPNARPPTTIRLSRVVRSHAERRNGHGVYARNLAIHSINVKEENTVEETVQLFLNRPSINSIAVVKDKKVVGIANRSRLQGLLAKPFGRDLYASRLISSVMEKAPLIVDAQLSIEQVSRMVTSRARYHQEDDFVICDQGEFLGIGHVIDLLKQVTELQLKQARHANPLTQLPGLIPINDCMEQLLVGQRNFVVCHFDIDNFKPFNDVYGFSKGDEVILALGQSLKSHADNASDTVGHIGGDDFVVLWNSEDWKERLKQVGQSFSNISRDLYLPEHVQDGGFECKDRYDETRFFPLTSISVAALEVETNQFNNAFEISSALSPLKAAAKQVAGNSLVINQAGNAQQL